MAQKKAALLDVDGTLLDSNDAHAQAWVEAFAQLGTELDKATQSQLDRGARLVELLKQPQFKPLPVEQEVIVIYAGTKGYLDDIPVSRVLEFQNDLLNYVDTSAPKLRADLIEKKDLTTDIEAALKQTIVDFKSRVWKK